MNKIYVSAALAGLVFALTSCGGIKPSTVTQPVFSIEFAGDWSGALVRRGITDKIALNIVRSGTTISGKLSISDGGTGGTYSGPITGQVFNDTIAFTTTIDASPSYSGFVGCRFDFSGYNEPRNSTISLASTATGSTCGYFADSRQFSILSK